MAAHPTTKVPPVPTDKATEAAQLLDEMLAKRGYLLSYHRLLAASSPKMLRSYDELYTSMTLDERDMTLAEREIVWIALIAATREHYAKFHLDRGVKAGLDEQAIADSVAIAAACEAFDATTFAAANFREWIAEERAMQGYLRTFDAARGSLPEAIAEVAAVVCHASRRNAAGMKVHLKRAFEKGARREQLAEGLSYVLLHRGGPVMIDAAGTWERVAGELGIPGPY
jgi:4-carboxymuconolactone decarboxylase